MLHYVETNHVALLTYLLNARSLTKIFTAELTVHCIYCSNFTAVITVYCIYCSNFTAVITVYCSATAVNRMVNTAVKLQL